MPDAPLISVVIPTYDRAAVLERCLEALAAQTLPDDAYEILVSDDGSRDDTEGVVRRFAARSPVPVRYLRQPNRGANAARNRAIHAASGEILLFINDDTIATPTLLEEHLRVFREHPDEEGLAVLGRVTISPEVPPSLFARLHLDANFDLWRGRRELDWRAFYTCNVSIRRGFLLAHGLFNENLRYHEDIELSARLAPHGLRLLHRPEALGHHLHHLTERDYLGVAGRDGEALARWYLESPHLESELAEAGFHPALPFRRRVRYWIADALINPLTRPLVLAAARAAARRRQDLALALYRKLFQAEKRRAIRSELARAR